MKTRWQAYWPFFLGGLIVFPYIVWSEGLIPAICIEVFSMTILCGMYWFTVRRRKS